MDPNGEIVEWFGAASDITKRKEAEAKLKETLDNLENLVKKRTSELEKAYNSLKESEKRLDEAQRMAHIGNWVWDIATDKEYWSDELHRIFKHDPQEAAPSYSEYLNYVHPDDRDYVDNAFKGTINGKPYEIDHRIILANGEERTVHIRAEVVFNDKNIPIQTKGIVQDITERKKAEENIQYLANIVESTTDAVVTISLDSIVTSWNKGAEQIFGYTAEEILGKKVSILEPENLRGEIKQLVENVMQGEKVKQYESSRLKKDGTIIIVSGILFPVFDTSGKLVAISVIVRDITDIKRAEKALKNLEIIRKKEIHHRIKNNLQVISSLLDLQAEKFNNRECINDSEVLEAFRESQDRVMSIAFIHEELHEGRGEDALNFSLYLQRLLQNLFQTYRFGNTEICLNLDLEENIFFGMDTAVPLGIIVNELISNSLKYAFSGRKTGEIQIKLFNRATSKDLNIKEELTGKCTRYTLIVSDNGVGIPEKIDFENSDTLGLQLVNLLVDQLDGTLELKRDQGTEFDEMLYIRFQSLSSHPRPLTPGL
jgi:PAS domain S-box-containing protein